MAMRKGHFRTNPSTGKKEWVAAHEVKTYGAVAVLDGPAAEDLADHEALAGLDPFGTPTTGDAVEALLDHEPTAPDAVLAVGKALNERYGDSPDLPLDETLRRWQSATRLRSELLALEEAGVQRLKDLGVGEGATFATTHGKLTVNVGKPRDEYDEEMCWANVTDEATKLLSDGELTPDQAVVAAARARLAAGGWKTDGLRQLGLNPEHYAYFSPREGEHGKFRFSLVPDLESPPTPAEQAWSSTFVHSLDTQQQHTDAPAVIAEQVAYISKVRADLKDTCDAHVARAAKDPALNPFVAGGRKPVVVKGAGTFSLHTQGSWAGWDHDKVWTDVAAKVQATAPGGGPASKRFDHARNTIRQVTSASWKKTSLKADGVFDQVHTAKPGRWSAKLK